VKKSKILSAGLAIFAMLFGAGNIVFPLALGRDSGSAVWFAMAGFFLTAALVPLLGIVSSCLFDGNYKKYLNMMGKIPGTLIALVCMLLIGPFGATPRCVATSYAALKWYIPAIPLPLFSIAAAALIFLLTFKKNRVIDIIGRFLGPIKIGLLFAIITLGLLSAKTLMPSDFSALKLFSTGVISGYGTLDLLSGLFFSALVLSGLKQGLTQEEQRDYKKIGMLGLQAGLIGVLLLGIVYSGFGLVAAFYKSHIQNVADAELFSALAELILGSKLGILAGITVAISCLATAVALTAVFAEYLRKEVLQSKVPYIVTLLVTVCITGAMTNLDFKGIMQMLAPVVVLAYPALIVLALCNVANKLFNFKWIRLPVAITFLASVYFQFGR
jgi:LIVCS family branched-chain amino acid:cation transporter